MLKTKLSVTYFVLITIFASIIDNGENIMSVLKEVMEFFLKGIRVFRVASCGCYKQDSEMMSEIRQDVSGMGKGRENVKGKLIVDRRNVEGDVRRGFDNVFSC